MELRRLASALGGTAEDAENWVAVELERIIRDYPPTAPASVTEWAVIMEKSGNVWKTHPTRESAQAFVDDYPTIPMYTGTREVSGSTRTNWRRA